MRTCSKTKKTTKSSVFPNQNARSLGRRLLPKNKQRRIKMNKYLPLNRKRARMPAAAHIMKIREIAVAIMETAAACREARKCS